MRLLCTRVLLLLALTLIHIDRAPAARAASPSPGPAVRVGQLGGAVRAVSAAGQLAVIGEGAALSVVDLGDAANPVWRATLPLADLVNSVQLVGTLAYVAVASQLVIVDVQDPANPRVRAMLPLGEQLRSVQVVGARLYALTEAGQAPIVDVRDPDRPGISGALVATSGRLLSLWVEGARAYLLTERGMLEIVDLADGATPLLRSSTFVDYAQFAIGLRVVDGVAYMLAGSILYFNAGALTLIDVRDPEHPRVRGSLGTDGDVAAVAVVGQRAYISTVWHSEATLVALDIRDLDHPVPTATFGPFAGAADLALVGTLLLAAGGENGLRLYDTQAAGVAPLAQLPGLGVAYAVRHSGGMAYVLSSRRLCIVDVRDPARPLLRGSIALPGEGTDLRVVGARAYVGLGEHTLQPGSKGLAVVDVQNADAPRVRGTVELSGPVQSLVVSGTVAYATYRSGFSYEGPNFAGIAAIDVSNDEAPVVRATIGAQARFDSVAVEGQRLYAISYHELRVFDIRAPFEPQSLGAFAIQLSEVGGAPRVQVERGRVYVAIDRELRIYDARVSNLPALVGTLKLPSVAFGLHVTGDTAVVPLSSKIAVVTVAEAPTLRGVAGVPDAVTGIDSDGALTYIAARNGGLLVQRIDPALFARVLLPVVGVR